MTLILTHRGLDPSIAGFPSESTYEAFTQHLKSGFGLEFDISFLEDGSIGIIHDADLSRLSEGLDKRKISDLSHQEFTSLRFKGYRLVLFEELLKMISTSVAPLHALHFKGKLQNENNILILISALNRVPEALEKLVIFDLLPSTAQIIAKSCNNVGRACSLSKSFDIERYGAVTGNTLLSLDEFYREKDLFNWVWLDEWDLSASDGSRQEFYCEDVFSSVRKVGAKIALVTPELHGTSPGLLGGEAHQDAKTLDLLTARIIRILKLSPDAVCTDYPDMVSQLVKLI